MVLPESIEKIITFVRNSDHPVSKREVAGYMSKLRLDLTLSYATVSHCMDDLVEDGILIEKDVHWKRGKRKYFIVNPKDEFSQILDIISKLRNDFMIIKKKDNPSFMRGSELDCIEKYSKVWAPYMNQWETHLHMLQDRTLNNLTSYKEIKLLYSKITQLKKEMDSEDFRVRMYVKHLKQKSTATK